VPSPGATLDVLTGKAGYLWQHSWVTTYETLLGFVIAVVVGVLAAVVMVYSFTVERTLYPVLLFAQVVPKIAIAPLFVVWLGFGIAPKILIAVLIAFFPVVISMVTGLKAVDPEMLGPAHGAGSQRGMGGSGEGAGAGGRRDGRRLRATAAREGPVGTVRHDLTLLHTEATEGKAPGVNTEADWQRTIDVFAEAGMVASPKAVADYWDTKSALKG